MNRILLGGSEMESKSYRPVNPVPRLHGLPENAQRRLQRIGVAATGVSATVWLVAAVWVWQIVA